MSVVVRVLLPYVAEMVTGVAAVTAVVLAVKVVLVAPAATVTLEGTETAACPLESDTKAPPDGAPADRNTVPCEDAPPVTLDGLTLTLCSVAAGGGGGGGGGGFGGNQPPLAQTGDYLVTLRVGNEVQRQVLRVEHVRGTTIPVVSANEQDQ